ncbi:hypothetical protein ACWGB8_01620 [Kitasatospora sp. NPDC054939]
MNARTRTARQTLRNRTRANQKRTIATHVRKATTDAAAAKGVTAALRKTARELRKAGLLGKVQTRIARVTADRVGPVYRYTAAQVALIAATYRPRKAEYKAAALRLTLAA